MSTEVLQELLKLPFGPYLDETILSKHCQHTSSKPLLLADLMLSYRGKPTGLDHTEFEAPFVPSNVAHLPPIISGSRVMFRGTLPIPAFTHLSDTGVKYLNSDFKERIMGSTLNGIKSVRKYSSYGIKDIFKLKAEQKQLPKAEQLEVRVLIQGYMNATASFMRSDITPDGLLFSTANAMKTSFRNFEIVSMDVQTYQLSRTFLFRYHTLRTLRDILATYRAGVPLHKRTPQWFLDCYFHSFAYPSHRRWSRINSLEDAESSDEGPMDLDQQPTCAQTHRPRHLRIIHKCEAWSVFASHSAWIFSRMQKELKGEAHGYGWEAFHAKVPPLRKRAASDQATNGWWGLEDELGPLCKSSTVVRISAPPALKSNPQSTASKKRKHISNSPPAPLSPEQHPVTHFQVIAESPTKGPHFDFDEYPNVYDSDFSQVSSSSNHSSFETTGTTSGSLHLGSLLPPEMFTPPTLPVNMVWNCPVGGGTCPYTVDMCSPSQDHLRLVCKQVPSGNIDHLLNREWKCGDEQVMTLFYEIVNSHWEDHLKELGIEFVRGNDASTFVRTHPEQLPLRTGKWQQWRARLQQST